MTLLKGHGTDADKEFRAALKARIEEIPYPKYRIAMEIGISQGQLSGILTNARAASLGLMEKIAKGLKTTVATMLLEGQEITGEKHQKGGKKKGLTYEQMIAVEAFEKILKSENLAAKMAVSNVLQIAKVLEEAENPTITKVAKSA